MFFVVVVCFFVFFLGGGLFVVFSGDVGWFDGGSSFITIINKLPGKLN